MLRRSLRCPYCREVAVSLLKKVVLLPPRQTACAACGRAVATPLLPLAVLDALVLVPCVSATTMDLRPFLRWLAGVREHVAAPHGHYVFLSGLFVAGVVFALVWAFLIPLIKAPRPLYVPRFGHLPPRLRRRG